MTDLAAYFAARLAAETDPSDVHAARRASEPLQLIDVRSADAWAQGRIPGAVHLPYRDIAARAPHELDPEVPVVVYCWGPGCNAGVRGALEFVRAGFRVREMIGGYEYWAREGYPVEDDSGPLARTFDPLTTVVRARVPAP